jgi:LAGLIDADG DNA endonuclease family
MKNNKNFATWTGMSKEVRDKLNVLQKSRIISINSTKLKKIEPNNECKLIAIYGSNLGSNIGLRLSQQSLDNLYLTPLIQQILVGILLGDANIRKVGENGKPHIQYNQGFIHLNHILYLSYLLSPILTHYPTLVQQRDLSTYLHLHTRALSSLIPLYELFIRNGVKKISPSIVNWLTPISLAFWAMDDGSSTPEGFYLNTHSFSYEEQIILQKALLYKFGLECNIHKHGKQFKLYIKAKSKLLFINLVKPYFSPFFYIN